LSFAIIFIVLIVGNISYRSFLNYQNTIITQQVEHLLTSSKSIGKSLELYVGEKEKSFKNMADNLGLYLAISENKDSNNNILKAMETFYINQEEEVSELFYMDIDKKIILSYPQNESSEIMENLYSEMDYVRGNKRSYIGKAYIDGDNSFSFDIVEPVIVNREIIGAVFGKIKLGNMQELLVKPVKAGKYGYAVVKDIDGKILMHPVKEHIGGDMVGFREEKYPDLDMREVRELLERQKAEKEGFYIYDSYWWPQEKLVRVKKISVFSRSIIGSDVWVISIIISYDEIKEPIERYLYGSILIATIIIIIFSWIVFLTVRMLKNKQAYDMETSYLREINKSAEELRKKDAELHHKRRLETIGTLTGGIAHEFNNVLTPIMGYSEMILRNLDPNIKSYDYARNIYDSSEKAREIIDEIRLFSGDKNIKIKYAIISANKVMRETLKLSESVFPSNIKVIKDIKEECGNIYANETQIHQVILNLCTNACNAMKGIDKGILKISMDSVKYQEGGLLKNSMLKKRDYIRMSFEDNGCGMDEDTIEKIFDPFFTKKLTEKSSGMGLSIVQGIVEKHGGSIEVYSEKDKGSRFDVYIPITTEKLVINNEDLNNIQIRGNERVLIIDDDKIIAEMLEDGLNELGYKATSMTDGSEVLKRFNYLKEHFEIVVTDLAMPDINGIQLAKKIKANKPDIKVILITACSEEPLEEYMQDKIIDEYLIKPATVAQISKTIRKIINN
jgi:signal transduction histidine kinase